MAPSAIGISAEHKLNYTPAGKVNYEVPRALTTEETKEIPQQFENAARMAKEAGFDGVEVHSANGYLLDTFLQSKTNRRTDKYGGSIENRARLLDEVVRAILRVWPSNCVAVRISPNGVFNEVGSPDYREQFLHVAKMLNAYNLAFLHVLNGLAIGFHELGTPMTLGEFRDVFDGPIMANCGYSLDNAEKDVREGYCEMVAFGRLYISNPDLVERHEKGIKTAPIPSTEYYYSPAGENYGAKGLTDYPKAELAQ